MIRIRNMKTRDIPAGMRLKEEAGWNQCVADWSRCLAMEPEGCFVAEKNGRVVGTTVAITFGPIAWLAMVLVDGNERRQGIGAALVRHALDWLDGRGIQTVRLQATTFGRPVYEKQGFSAEAEMVRFLGDLAPTDEPDVTIPFREEFLPALYALDRAATGTDRRRFLFHLIEENWQSCRAVLRDGALAGFFLLRHGSRQLRLGPICGDAAAGEALLRYARLRYAGMAVCFDTPAGLEATSAAGRQAGLQPQPGALQMVRGTAPTWDKEHLWAIAGPDLG